MTSQRDAALHPAAADPNPLILSAGSKDHAFVIINSNSRSSSEVHLLDAARPVSDPALVQGRTAGLEYFVQHHRGRLAILTNAGGAEDYAVMVADVARPGQEAWRPLVPQRPGVSVEDMDLIGSCLVLMERRDGRPGVSRELRACRRSLSLAPGNRPAAKALDTPAPSRRSAGHGRGLARAPGPPAPRLGRLSAWGREPGQDPPAPGAGLPRSPGHPRGHRPCPMFQRSRLPPVDTRAARPRLPGEAQEVAQALLRRRVWLWLGQAAHR